MNASWKTSLCGALVAITAWANLVVAILDSNPSTTPNWDSAIALTIAAIGLIYAKDKNVTNSTSDGPAHVHGA